jgi:hypothetical protein
MNASRLQPLPTSRHPHWIDPNVPRGDISETREVSKDWLVSAEPQTQDKKIVAYIRTAAPILLNVHGFGTSEESDDNTWAADAEPPEELAALAEILSSIY